MKALSRRMGDIHPCTIAGLIKVTRYLLNRQIQKLEQDFLTEGGLRERMTRARLNARDRQRSGNTKPDNSKSPGKGKGQNAFFIIQCLKAPFGCSYSSGHFKFTQ